MNNEDINYDGRSFRGIFNYDDGDFDSSVIFHYQENNGVLWGTFQGKRIAIGTFIAVKSLSNRISMHWQYVDIDTKFHHGVALLAPEVLEDGRLRLHEQWATLSDKPSLGTSIIEQLHDRT